MKFEKMEYNIIALALIALILILAIIMSNNFIQMENLELNRHVLEDCKIDPSEFDYQKPVKSDMGDF
jgi:hypothetical protein